MMNDNNNVFMNSGLHLITSIIVENVDPKAIRSLAATCKNMWNNFKKFAPPKTYVYFPITCMMSPTPGYIGYYCALNNIKTNNSLKMLKIEYTEKQRPLGKYVPTDNIEEADEVHLTVEPKHSNFVREILEDMGINDTREKSEEYNELMKHRKFYNLEQFKAFYKFIRKYYQVIEVQSQKIELEEFTVYT